MELGDRVVYYTHEMNDFDHRTVDRLAFVTQIVDDETVDLVVFPPGGPIEFFRASTYDPDNPYLTAGNSFWRPAGEDPPDFSNLDFANEPEWGTLLRNQQAEFERTAVEGRDAVIDKHRQQREELHDRLSERYGRNK